MKHRGHISFACVLATVMKFGKSLIKGMHDFMPDDGLLSAKVWHLFMCPHLLAGA